MLQAFKKYYLRDLYSFTSDHPYSSLEYDIVIAYDRIIIDALAIDYYYLERRFQDVLGNNYY
jgi:hypothetical protein